MAALDVHYCVIKYDQNVGHKVAHKYDLPPPNQGELPRLSLYFVLEGWESLDRDQFSKFKGRVLDFAETQLPKSGNERSQILDDLFQKIQVIEEKHFGLPASQKEKKRVKINQLVNFAFFNEERIGESAEYHFVVDVIQKFNSSLHSLIVDKESGLIKIVDKTNQNDDSFVPERPCCVNNCG